MTQDIRGTQTTDQAEGSLPSSVRGAAPSRRAVMLGAGSVLPMIGLAACTGGSSSGGDSGGDGSDGGEGAAPEPTTPPLEDHIDMAKDVEVLDLSGALGAKISLPRSEKARGLSEALDISVTKILREETMRGADPAGVTVKPAVIACAADALAVRLEVTDSEGSYPVLVGYSAKGDRAWAPTALIEEGQWKAFVDAVAKAREASGASDGDALRDLCREQPRPWGNGPTILPTTEGGLTVSFPTLGDKGTVEIEPGATPDLLSEVGTAIVKAAGTPAAFDPGTVATPSPQTHSGDEVYEQPEEIFIAQPARESKGPGPRTQLAPLAEPGTRPSVAAAPDATRLRALALTFDDGPSPELNKTLRDHLAKAGAAATFFMIGQSVKSFAKYCTETSRAGFEVGGHSWSHPVLSKRSEQKVDEEMHKTTDAIRDAIGRGPFVMRPPYGARNKKVDDIVGKYAQSVQMWDVDSLDWKHKNVGKNLEEIKKASRRGSIILMHEIHAPSVETVPQALEWFAAEGYTLLTCSELGQNQMWAGKHYTNGLVTASEKKRERPAASDGGH